MKLKKKISKNAFLKGFLAVTAILALVRLFFPSIAQSGWEQLVAEADSLATTSLPDSLRILQQSHIGRRTPTSFYDHTQQERHNRVKGVADYDEAFPDSQQVQLESAMTFGVASVKDRADAEQRKNHLVYIGADPYFELQKLTSSIPYLVPRAAILLQDIGRNFMDSLQIKHLPLHKILVTSVLRTKNDVESLRRYNRNATENSCHLYGTTFDIAYNKYVPIGREVRNDSLKYVLSEVLDDLRKQGRCYIKYERKQGCFHITTR